MKEYDTDSIIFPDEDTPTVEPYMIKCKFTIESSETLNGAVNKKCVHFEGCTPIKLYGAVVDAVRDVMGK